MRFLSAGDQALLVELQDLAQTMALYRACLAQPLPGVQALVPAARTLLLQFAPWATTAAQLQQALLQRALPAAQVPQAGGAGRLVRVPVDYSGEDLPQVAELLGLRVQEVIAQHTAQPYDAAFAGFAPGFVYLSGGAHWQLPRRSTPRTRVPAGAVALGGAFSAVYPSASPGGWQLIGSTHVAMWDVARAEPAYIQPGFRVQFVDVRHVPPQVFLPPQPAPTQHQSPGYLNPPERSPAVADIECLQAGLYTAFQDHGRWGQQGLGIAPSGALDRGAMHCANRSVGNPMDAPVLENVLGQLVLQAHGPCTLAVAGAQALLQVRSHSGAVWAVPPAQAVALNAGDRLQLGAVQAGVRCYVAVRGGWHVQPVLGSCATDSLAQLGPPPLQPGQRVAVGAALPAAQLQAVPEPGVEGCGLASALPQPGDTVTLDVVLGPRSDWFTAQALQTLTQQAWTVTPQSNRIGMRLQGAAPLQRAVVGELPSEGTVAGALQVPLDGQPVLFLADHPLTGGYPVVAALASYHLDVAAQIPVGCHLRFRVVAPLPEAASIQKG